MIPATSDPWRTVEHDGVRYRVRFIAGACWVSRVNDGAIWFFEEKEAPTWTREAIASDGPQKRLF